MKTESGASGGATSYECGDLSLLKCSQGGCRREKMKRERENLTGGRYNTRVLGHQGGQLGGLE